MDFALPAGSPARSFAFVAIDSGITEFADPHEATHNTWDFNHFDLQAAGAAAPGNIDGKNLMHGFFLANNLGTSNPKRLWNAAFNNNLRVPPLVNPPQIDRIRASRFARPY